MYTFVLHEHSAVLNVFFVCDYRIFNADQKDSLVDGV